MGGSNNFQNLLAVLQQHQQPDAAAASPAAAAGGYPRPPQSQQQQLLPMRQQPQYNNNNDDSSSNNTGHYYRAPPPQQQQQHQAAQQQQQQQQPPRISSLMMLINRSQQQQQQRQQQQMRSASRQPSPPLPPQQQPQQPPAVFQVPVQHMTAPPQPPQPPPPPPLPLQQQPQPQQQPPPFTTHPSYSTSPCSVLCLTLSHSPLPAFELTESDVDAVVRVFGPVQQLSLVQSVPVSGAYDTAVVWYSSEVSAAAAAAELNRTELPGLGTLVAVATPVEPINRASSDPVALSNLVCRQVLQQQPLPQQQPTQQQQQQAPLQQQLQQQIPPQQIPSQPPFAVGPSPTGVVQPPPPPPPASATHMIGSGREFGGVHHPQGSRPKKRVCRLELVDLFAHHPEFDVVAAVCGKNGNNINYVLKEAKERCDIDMDGVPANQAPVAERLHLTVTALDDETYEIAVDTVEDLLTSVCQQYTEFCQMKGQPAPTTLGFRRHEYVEGQDGQLVYLGQKSN